MLSARTGSKNIPIVNESEFHIGINVCRKKSDHYRENKIMGYPIHILVYMYLEPGVLYAPERYVLFNTHF